MKKKIFGFLMPLALLASCDSYLDVKSEFDVDSDEIFSTTAGVEMAVNGVYRLMAGTSLYARDLTWGYASILGQNYKLGISSGKYDITYDHKNFAAYPAAIWEKGFNVIANANQVLANIKDKDASFFGNEIHKTLIEGEMHGIRALMHFDLMRLFTPAPTTAENKNTVLMPYVDTYPCPYPTHIKTSELFKKAVKDMEIAREKLGSLDTLEFMKWNRTLNDRFFSMSSASSACPNLFFYARGTRMNFMAATALLARMHMWNGDYAKARKYAEELVNGYNGQYIYYKFEPSANLTKPASFRPTRPEELIFAVTRNLEDSRKEFERYVGADYSKTNFTMDDQVMDALFAGDDTDPRYSGLYWKQSTYYNSRHYSTYTRMSKDIGGFNDTNMQYYANLFPIISLPEMWHIIAECDIRDGNVANAMDILISLRQIRGILEYELPTDVTPEEAMNHLRTEVVREGLTFGQTFFWFKRQGKNVWNGLNEIEMNEEKWTIPVPDSETI